MIRSVSENQFEILRDIMTLYCPKGFELDPMYGLGMFYRHGIPEPLVALDITPRRLEVKQGDASDLPMGSSTVASMILDPPFIHAHGKESTIGARFSSLPTQHAIRRLYMEILTEAYRVLKPKGILVFKHQDIVESGKQVWNSHHIWQMATGLGFEQVDLFILVASHRMQGHNHGKQQHARKVHSYFSVLQKGPRR